jgi:D-alanine-D-alanine ligase-like ATP-grasp enzyme
VAKDTEGRSAQYMADITKTRVAIVFGGQSAEHEISIPSARNVLEALDQTRFEPVLIGIDNCWRAHVIPVVAHSVQSLNCRRADIFRAVCACSGFSVACI